MASARPPPLAVRGGGGGGGCPRASTSLGSRWAAGGGAVHVPPRPWAAGGRRGGGAVHVPPRPWAAGGRRGGGGGQTGGGQWGARVSPVPNTARPAAAALEGAPLPDRQWSCSTASGGGRGGREALANQQQLGVGRLSTSRGPYSPLIRHHAPPPPPKRAELTGPSKSYQDDPWARRGDLDPKFGRNENGIFGISASRGFRKVIICHVFW